MNNQNYTTDLFTEIRQNRGIFPVILMSLLWLLSCAPASDISGPPFSADLLPPELQKALTPDARKICFIFDEPVIPAQSGVRVEPDLSVNSITADGNSLTVLFDSDQMIGESYTARISVSDTSGNSLLFLYRFSGWNPRIPEILINEINPRGSGKTPDCIELYAATGGNLGGLCLKVGSENRYSAEIIFPAVEIPGGEFLLVHAKAEGIAEEIDEIENLDASGGLLAVDCARDFWLPGAPGLPGNNGAVTLYTRKGGEIIDAVLWSNRSDNSNDEKLGWTGEGFIFASDLAAGGAWTAEYAEIPYPSEAIDVSLSTATRSLCRNRVPADSNRNSDWHTVPTRGQSFGTANTDEIYEP